MFRIFAVYVILSFSSFVYSQHDHKVKVAVYYESMCPDSISFVTKQLYPAFQNPELNKHINLTLIPYGKSKTIQDGSDYRFECHHGPAECTGNRIHACALQKIPTSPDGQNTVAVDFINCLLATVDRKGDKTEFPVKTCAESQKVTNTQVIENCAGTHEGARLLSTFGQKTNALQDPLRSVPTVVFDEKFDENENASAQKDFVQVLCKHIPHDKPQECKNKNGAGTLAVPLGITLVTLFLTLRLY